eukprot:379149_1
MIVHLSENILIYLFKYLVTKKMFFTKHSQMAHLIILIVLITSNYSQSITCTEFSTDPDCISPITCTSTNCQVQCNDRGCQNKIINCPNGQCDIYCTGQDGCNQATINCPNDYGCNIQCGASGCLNAQINGGSTNNARLIVTCTHINSCKYATFDARYAHELTIQECTWNDACIGITVYCPPHDNGGKKCTISGDDSMGGTAIDPIKFYAVNGFDDITINSITINRYGNIYCQNNYTASCTIEQNPLQLNPSKTLNAQWTCQGGGKCTDLTLNPIPSPTNNPITNIPTTVIPTTTQPTKLNDCTKDLLICGDGTTIGRVQPDCKFASCPTQQPTTFAPTFQPTIKPTFNPTKKECIDKFEAIISLSFGYVETSNDLSSEQIDNIITNITNKFINDDIKNKFDNDCSLQYSDVNVIIDNNVKEAIVNISVCFDCKGNKLSIDNDDIINELEKDFINLFNEETNILLIAQNSNVLITVIIQKQPEGLYSDISTTLNHIKDREHLRDDKNDYTSSIVIGVLIVLMIICLCVVIGIFMYRAKHKEKQNENISNANIAMSWSVHNPINSDKTDINSNEIGEILDEDDTNSDGNMAVTAGGDYDTNEIIIESDEDNNIGTPAGNMGMDKTVPFAKIKTISSNMEGGRISFGNDEIIIGNDENNEYYTPKYNNEIIIDAESDNDDIQTTDEGNDDGSIINVVNHMTRN